MDIVPEGAPEGSGYYKMPTSGEITDSLREAGLMADEDSDAFYASLAALLAGRRKRGKDLPISWSVTVNEMAKKVGPERSAQLDDQFSAAMEVLVDDEQVRAAAAEERVRLQKLDAQYKANS